jgi:type I restriction enzyme, S subunit
MEMKKGYQQTDVGLIPQDWQVRLLGDLCEKVTTGKLDANAMVSDGQYPFFTCAKESYLIDRYAFDSESLLVSGNGANVGYIHYYKGKFNAYQRTYVLTGFADNIHFVKLFMERNLQERIRTEVNAGNTPYIKMDTLTQMKVALPNNKSEQDAIVKVLTDADDLVSTLDELISKKRDLKQATMQQFLTGRQRLPGFNGEWKIKQLGEVGVFRGGNGFPTRLQGLVEGEYPFFKVSDMNNEGNATFMVNSNNWISETVRKTIGATTFPSHSTVFAKIGAAIFLERKKILLRDSCIDNNMMGFIPNKPLVDHLFIHYLFLTIRLGKLVSTTALPSLNGNELAKLEFSFPLLDEQIAIASILSDMDAEIASLEQRRDKTQAIKEGMMQELLIGKTRLL